MLVTVAWVYFWNFLYVYKHTHVLNLFFTQIDHTVHTIWKFVFFPDPRVRTFLMNNICINSPSLRGAGESFTFTESIL